MSTSTSDTDDLTAPCSRVTALREERDNLRALLRRLSEHMLDKPDGSPSWEPTDPAEVAGWLERAEALLAAAADIEVLHAQLADAKEELARARGEERIELRRLPTTQLYATHLGDGAYVSVIGQEVVFTANHHDPEEASGCVWLSYDGMAQLARWLRERGVM